MNGGTRPRYTVALEREGIVLQTNNLAAALRRFEAVAAECRDLQVSLHDEVNGSIVARQEGQEERAACP